MKEKRCIFHIPNYIDKTSKSGSSVRPQMMIKAFEEIGYHVDYVMGYGKERKSQIEKIKRNIRNGVKYEFLYAENSTTPTLLTEKIICKDKVYKLKLDFIYEKELQVLLVIEDITAIEKTESLRREFVSNARKL